MTTTTILMKEKKSKREAMWDIEGIAKYPSDFLEDKNYYHNFTIVAGTFRSDIRFFFSNYLTLKLRSRSPLPSELIYLYTNLFQIYLSIMEIPMV